jgi:hypothetical protein
VPRLQSLSGEGGARRQREGGLGDVALGSGDDEPAEVLDLLVGGGRADEHPVAAGAVHFLDHELGEVREDVLEVLRPAQHPGLHVADQRRLAE